MSLATLTKLEDHVLQMAGLPGAASSSWRTLATEWVNKSHQDVMEAYDWDEVIKPFQLNTVAPDTTGTVDMVLGDATVEGTSVNDWSSPSLANRKFSLGYGNPWFEIDSITDADTLELDRAWPFASASTQSFTIYEDVYALDTTVQKLLTDRITLHDSDGRRLCRLPHGDFIRERDFPTAAGKPEYFTMIERGSTGLHQIQLGARAPDAVYIIRYYAKVKHVEMTSGSDIPQLDESLLELVADGALIRAYGLPQFIGSGLRAQQQGLYDKKLAEKIKRRQRQSPRGVKPKAFGVHGTTRYPFTFPVSAD